MTTTPTPASQPSSRLIPDAECVQSKCMNATTGCRDVCELRGNPPAIVSSQPSPAPEPYKLQANAGPVPGNYPMDRLIASLPLPQYPASESPSPARSDSTERKCYSCKQAYTDDQRADADGLCPHCGVEIELLAQAARSDMPDTERAKPWPQVNAEAIAAQDLLDWNRRQPKPLIEVTKELGVARKAFEFLAAAHTIVAAQVAHQAGLAERTPSSDSLREAFDAAFLSWNGFHTKAELDAEWAHGTLAGEMFRAGAALARRATAGTTAPEKPFAGPGAWFSVDILGNPVRQYAPGKWENAVWPSSVAGTTAPAQIYQTWGPIYGGWNDNDKEEFDRTPESERRIVYLAATAVPGDLPPLPEMHSLADIAYACATPDDWDADYRSTWQKLQVAERNKVQWRVYALDLRSRLASNAGAAPADAKPEPEPKPEPVEITREGRMFWHTNCPENKFKSGIMRVEKDEPHASLIRCGHCGKAGYYPVGGAGTVCAAEVAPSQEKDQ